MKSNIQGLITKADLNTHEGNKRSEYMMRVFMWLWKYDYNDVAAAAKSLQSCPTLCDPRDGSPPGSPVPGILQARTLEWLAISFSSAWKWKVKVKSLSCVRLLAIPWTAAHQAPPSMGFSRQGYWSGVPLPSPISKKTPCRCASDKITNANHGQDDSKVHGRWEGFPGGSDAGDRFRLWSWRTLPAAEQLGPSATTIEPVL